MFSVAELRAALPTLPEPVISTIRYDAEGKRVSVIDVFRVLTGATSNHAGRDLDTAISANPQVVPMVDHFKFPGQGQRDTPVCDAKTLTLLIMDHPSPKVRLGC